MGCLHFPPPLGLLHTSGGLTVSGDLGVRTERHLAFSCQPHSLLWEGCVMIHMALWIQCVTAASWGIGNFLLRLCHPSDRRIFCKASCVPVPLDTSQSTFFQEGIAAFLEVLLGSWAEAPCALGDHRSPSCLPVWGSLFLDILASRTVGRQVLLPALPSSTSSKSVSDGQLRGWWRAKEMEKIREKKHR